MEPNCPISPHGQKLQSLLVRELCDVLPVKVCGQWDASSTTGQSYLETNISLLALEYQKKFELACISAVAKIINLPYYFWNLKVKLCRTIAQVGRWYLLSQRPRLILA
jgi:hypothetical protein